MTHEEGGEEPICCPFCGSEDDIDVLGKTADGAYVISCERCSLEVLIKDVTGKVRITIEVEG